MFEPLNRVCDNLEKKVFNPIGYIPIVGTLSGTVRAGVFAPLQFKVGLIGAVAFTALGICQVATTYTKAASGSFSRAGEGIQYMVHGLLNAARGTVELIPFLPWVTCMPYDVAGGNILPYRVKNSKPERVVEKIIIYKTHTEESSSNRAEATSPKMVDKGTMTDISIPTNQITPTSLTSALA